MAATAALVAGLTLWIDREGSDAPGTSSVDVGGMVPTRGRLAGIWLLDGATSAPPGGDALMVLFRADGTVIFDDKGHLDTSPAVAATYQLHGRTISFRVGRGTAVCTPGDTWAWQAGLPDEGRLKAVTVEDGTGICSEGIGSELTFTRVSPLSPFFELAYPTPSAHAAPPPDEVALHGIWLLQGSGSLLRLSEDGSYAIDGTGELGTDPSDMGTFRVHAGTVTFTSGASSRACRPGDRWVWKDVAQDGRATEGTVTKDECRDRADGSTWGVHDILAYRLSPS